MMNIPVKTAAAASLSLALKSQAQLRRARRSDDEVTKISAFPHFFEELKAAVEADNERSEDD
jgi:hypothetical protein